MKAKNVTVHLGFLCSALLLFFSESGCALQHAASNPCRDGASDRPSRCFATTDGSDGSETVVEADADSEADVMADAADADDTMEMTDVAEASVDVMDVHVEDTGPEVGPDVADVTDVIDVTEVADVRDVQEVQDVRDVIAEDAMTPDIMDVPVPTDVPPDRVSPDTGPDAPVVPDAGGPNLEIILTDDAGYPPVRGLIVQVLPPGVADTTALEDPAYPMAEATCVPTITPGTSVRCLLSAPVASGSLVRVNGFYTAPGTFPAGPDSMVCQTRGSFPPRCPRMPTNLQAIFGGVPIAPPTEYPIGSMNYPPWGGSLQFLPFIAR